MPFFLVLAGLTYLACDFLESCDRDYDSSKKSTSSSSFSYSEQKQYTTSTKYISKSEVPYSIAIKNGTICPNCTTKNRVDTKQCVCCGKSL